MYIIDTVFGIELEEWSIFSASKGSFRMIDLVVKIRTVQEIHILQCAPPQKRIMIVLFKCRQCTKFNFKREPAASHN